MSLRRPRSHKVGISNIDFRTKRDIENLNIYEPWKVPKDLGTMGYKNYKNSKSIYQNLFGPSEKINTYKDIVNDYPDPRFHTTAQFYQKNKILLNTKTFINTERVANLEETFKGKDVFNGDSTNIADIMRFRKTKKFDNKTIIRNSYKEPFSLEERKIQEEKIKNLAKEKKSLNKNAIQETQLVKINTFIDKGDTVINLKKIEEVRETLRRRYGNRKKINKIFQQWAKTFPNKITVYDAYKMINALSIPINYNETKAFIASGSNSGNEYLTLQEFSNLIYEPSKMCYDEEKKYLIDQNDQKKFEENIISNNNIKSDERNMSKLKDFISQRIFVLIKSLKELSKEKYSFTNTSEFKNNPQLNKVDYNKFKNGILSLRPSDNFGKEEYIKKLFDEYKGKDGLIDMQYFNENIFEKNSKEFMTKQKDKFIEISKEQYEEKKNKLQNYIKENENKVKSLFFQKKVDLDEQIIQKKKILKNINNNNNFEKHVNSTTPSTQWLHHIYDNRDEHYKILNRAEHALSAKPSLRQNNLKCNTRFSAAPAWRNTANILIGDEQCCTYINEKDRFNFDRDINKEDKQKKNIERIRRENRIRTAREKYENNNYMKMFLKEEKDIFSDMEKNKRLAMYDEISKNRNFIIE